MAIVCSGPINIDMKMADDIVLASLYLLILSAIAMLEVIFAMIVISSTYICSF